MPQPLVARFCRTPHDVARATIGTQGFTIAPDGQEYARMRVPQGLRRQRTVQRKVGRRDFHYFKSVAVGGCGFHGASDVVQPVAILFSAAVDDIEKHTLQLLGERAALSGADGATVHFADWRDFGRRSREEYLVGNI